jgi:hypothetical protein
MLRTCSHQNCDLVELSSQQCGSSKIVQLLIQREHPWRSFGKCFRSTLFQCAASFHGLHVRLISLPVIISFDGTSKAYTTRPRTIDELKIAIRKQISAVPGNMARRALGNLRASLGECVCSEGQHLKARPHYSCSCSPGLCSSRDSSGFYLCS